MPLQRDREVVAVDGGDGHSHGQHPAAVELESQSDLWDAVEAEAPRASVSAPMPSR